MKGADRVRIGYESVAEHKRLRLIGDSCLIGQEDVLSIPYHRVVVVADKVAAVERMLGAHLVIDSAQDLVFAIVVHNPILNAAARIARN